MKIASIPSGPCVRHLAIAARQDGFLDTSNPRHAWIVTSFFVVGVMAVVALAYLGPANVAVLFELRKSQPDPLVVQVLMRRFVYTAGITGVASCASSSTAAGK